MTVTFRILFTEVEAEGPGTVRLVLGLRGLAVELRRIDDQTGVDDCSQLYNLFTSCMSPSLREGSRYQIG